MKVKVKYLNWDDEVKTIGPGNLFMCFITGGVANLYKDYRDINSYSVNFTSLDDVFREHNMIDDETFCRLKDGQRSMCVGDLIYLDDVCYVVKNCGFEKVAI